MKMIKSRQKFKADFSIWIYKNNFLEMRNDSKHIWRANFYFQTLFLSFIFTILIISWFNALFYSKSRLCPLCWYLRRWPIGVRPIFWVDPISNRSNERCDFTRSTTYAFYAKIGRNLWPLQKTSQPGWNYAFVSSTWFDVWRYVFD